MATPLPERRLATLSKASLRDSVWSSLETQICGRRVRFDGELWRPILPLPEILSGCSGYMMPLMSIRAAANYEILADRSRIGLLSKGNAAEQTGERAVVMI
jgi:hypothetical protein